jgi:hypothetical protein
MIDKLTKIFVGANALVWIAFGPAFYFAPDALAGRLDIALGSPTALADFRAMYGVGMIIYLFAALELGAIVGAVLLYRMQPSAEM